MTDTADLIARAEAALAAGRLDETDAVDLLVALKDEWANHQAAEEKTLRALAACIKIMDRATAAEAKLAEWQASQHYSYIDRAGKRVLARALEDKLDAAEAKLAEALDEAASVASSYGIDWTHDKETPTKDAIARAILAKIGGEG